MKKYILALDQGTTSSRCIVYDKKGRVISVGQREFPQIYPKPGWVEHDPEIIWSSQLEAVKDAMKNAAVSFDEIATIGITNQRETTVVWNRKSGKPLCNAIVWQCRRTASYCDGIRRSEYDTVLKDKTGLVCDPYFSLTKVKYILDNVPGAYEAAKNGDIAFGTIDSWLIFKLTEGSKHVTDITNASRTMMYNIHEGKWDNDILQHFDIPFEILPEVLPSSGYFGEATVFGISIPVCGVAGDQQASLFGQCCFDKGDVKNTYGTGCFLLMNTGEEAVRSDNGLVTTIAWQISDKITYALEGSVFVAGAAIQWLRDGLGVLASSSESEKMARSVNGTGGVYFVPAFTGLGAPYWDPDARGMICGISRGTNRNHLVRAALEAMAYQTDDVIKLMEKESGNILKTLRVDGGASVNGFLCSFQADISGISVERPKNTETTSLGAAYLAGLGCGMYASLSEIAQLKKPDKIFLPSMSDENRMVRLLGWQSAVKRTILK